MNQTPTTQKSTNLLTASGFAIKVIKEGDHIVKGDQSGTVDRIVKGYRFKYVYYDFHLTNGTILNASCCR